MVDTDDTRRTTDAGRRTTPWVWHKLPTGELINLSLLGHMLIVDQSSHSHGTVGLLSGPKSFQHQKTLVTTTFQIIGF